MSYVKGIAAMFAVGVFGFLVTHLLAVGLFAVAIAGVLVAETVDAVTGWGRYVVPVVVGLFVVGLLDMGRRQVTERRPSRER